ncbi:MAG: hypothetical protein JW751_16305 [Polyangiaceae bacterium]|nr:hypothetical protein [Polyangiaceae bacterium]
MVRRVAVFWLGVGSVLVGCVAPVGSRIRIPRDAAAKCAEQCERTGMELSAVAIMAENIGCVCVSEPSDQTTSASAPPASSAASPTPAPAPRERPAPTADTATTPAPEPTPKDPPIPDGSTETPAQGAGPEPPAAMPTQQ